MRPTKNFIAICARSPDKNTTEIQYLDAASGNLVFSSVVVGYDQGNLTGATDTVNGNQQGTFTPTYVITGELIRPCAAVPFNNDLTRVAGTDKYPTGDQVPATMDLVSGTVTDALPPADHTGFAAVDPVSFEGAAFAPRDDTLWWLNCASYKSPRLGSNRGTNEVINDPGIADIQQICPSAGGSSMPFVFTNSGGRPLISGTNNIPTDCGAKMYACNDVVVPRTDLGVGSIRVSDDNSSGAFVACSGATPPQCGVYTIPLSGGDPTKIVDLDPGVTGRVIRYVS